jgi:glycerophosphoryl diester phosphodiesterase
MMKTSRSHRARRHLAAGIAAAVLTGSSVAAFAQDGPAEAPVKDRPPIAVIAHRGGALLRPENTMPAFEHAAGIGAEYLEFDMEMTADDRIAVYHDATINTDFCKQRSGAAATPAPVRALSFAATQELDCGAGVRPQYAGPRHVAVPGARIPELGEVLRAFRDSDALFFAETKIPKGADIDPVKFATLLDAAVRENGLEDRLILQSFDFRTIDALHTINPRIRTCLLGVPRQTRDYLAMLRQHNATCIVLADNEIDSAETASLRTAGILVFSGVADREEQWQKYVDLGFDAIFTNDPEGVIRFLDRSGLRK